MMVTTPADLCLTATACLPSSEWAAWVQAVGSVIAILVAIAIPALQHGLENRRVRRQRMFEVVRSISISILMLERVHDMIQTAKPKLAEDDPFGGPTFRQLLSRHLEDGVTAMRNLSLHEHMHSSQSAVMWLTCITWLDGVGDPCKMTDAPLDEVIGTTMSKVSDTLIHLRSEHSEAKRAAAR